MSGVQPQIIDLSCNSPNELSVKWTLTGNSEGYTLTKFYLYEKYPDMSDSLYIIDISSEIRNDTSGSFVKSGLISDSIKDYSIQAYYTYNDGAASFLSTSSNVISYQVYGNPSKPIITSFNNNFPRRMDIIWQSPNSNVSALQFIDVSYSNTTYQPTPKRTSASNPAIISDISKGTYSIQIKTINTSGFESDYSDVSNVTIYDIPSQPSFANIADISLNTINIRYNYNEPGNAPILSANYQFEYNSQIYTDYSPVYDSSFNVNLSIRNSLSQWIYGNNYTNIKFKLINQVGSSVFSDSSSYIPKSAPSNVTYKYAEPFDGSNTTQDCSSYIFFSCNNNGSSINEISGNFMNENSELIRPGEFIVRSSDITYINVEPGNTYNYKFILPGIKLDQNNYIKFNCKNNQGYADISVNTNIFFPTPVIENVSIYNIDYNNNSSTITFETLNTTINNYDTIKYSFRFKNSTVDDGSGIITKSDINNNIFSISDPSFNGNQILFFFWLKNQAFTSREYSSVTVYMVPPTTPFISILPVGEYIQVSYYTNISRSIQISMPIRNIIYDISGGYNERGVNYIPTDEDSPFEFYILLPPISERSATQSYSVRAKFTNMFGESDWSNYAYINNDCIIEYTTSNTNCRYTSVTPARRFELISPYDLGYKQEQLDSRRKYEVLQYFGSSSTSNVKNNFTNRNRYALVSRGSNIRGIDRAQGITANNFSCIVEPSGFFNIPLYNYTVNRQYDKYEELPSPQEWYMNYVKNQEFESNIENKMLSIYVNKYIRAPLSNINIKNSIFIELSGRVREGSFDKKITYTIISCEVNVYNATPVGSPPIRTYNVRLTQNPPLSPNPIEGTTPFVFNPVEGSPQNFRVIYYCGDLDFTMGNLPTVNGNAYDIKCTFVIERQTGQNVAIIDNPRVRVITAGRSVKSL